jgi:hypothetical protein
MIVRATQLSSPAATPAAGLLPEKMLRRRQVRAWPKVQVDLPTLRRRAPPPGGAPVFL